MSLSTAAKNLKIKNKNNKSIGTSISKCCNGKGITSYGFKWTYLEKIIEDMPIRGYTEVTLKEFKKYENKIIFSYLDKGRLIDANYIVSRNEIGVDCVSRGPNHFVQYIDLEKVWILTQDI